MASIQFDHVGVVVHDSGAWMDRVVGLEGARVELIIVTAPNGSGKLELTAFHEPRTPAVSLN